MWNLLVELVVWLVGLLIDELSAASLTKSMTWYALMSLFVSTGEEQPAAVQQCAQLELHNKR